jgi:hypothetical protein
MIYGVRRLEGEKVRRLIGLQDYGIMNLGF